MEFDVPEKVPRPETGTKRTCRTLNPDVGTPQKLCVKMDFPQNSAVRNKRNKLHAEKRKREKLQRANWVLKKRLDSNRHTNTESSSNENEVESNKDSPADKAENLLRQDGISPTKAHHSFSAIALGEILMDAVENLTPKRKEMFGELILTNGALKDSRLKSEFLQANLTS